MKSKRQTLDTCRSISMRSLCSYFNFRLSTFPAGIHVTSLLALTIMLNFSFGHDCHTLCRQLLLIPWYAVSCHMRVYGVIFTECTILVNLGKARYLQFWWLSANAASTATTGLVWLQVRQFFDAHLIFISLHLGTHHLTFLQRRWHFPRNNSKWTWPGPSRRIRKYPEAIILSFLTRSFEMLSAIVGRPLIFAFGLGTILRRRQ